MPKIKCSYCKKEFVYESVNDHPFFPFCSKKCKMIDLGIWLEEGYKIETPLRTGIDSVYDEIDI